VRRATVAARELATQTLICCKPQALRAYVWSFVAAHAH
jgi:hypothetical protein